MKYKVSLDKIRSTLVSEEHKPAMNDYAKCLYNQAKRLFKALLSISKPEEITFSSMSLYMFLLTNELIFKSNYTEVNHETILNSTIKKYSHNIYQLLTENEGNEKHSSWKISDNNYLRYIGHELLGLLEKAKLDRFIHNYPNLRYGLMIQNEKEYYAALEMDLGGICDATKKYFKIMRD